jgi:PAS domain-containing protein
MNAGPPSEAREAEPEGTESRPSAVEIAGAGSLGVEPVSDLLQRLSEQGFTGKFRVKSDFGPATAWLEAGAVLDARFGLLRAEPALLRLLGLADGAYEINPGPVTHKRVIAESLPALVERSRQRSERWAALVERLPPLSTVVDVDLDTLISVGSALPQRLLALTELIDGRRAIVEIIEDSQRDAVQVLEEIAELLAMGLVRHGVAEWIEFDGSGSGRLPVAESSDSWTSGDAPPSTERLSVAPPMPKARGAMLGRYEVLSKIGRGGVGTVYLARVSGPDGFRRDYAVKVLRAHLSRSHEAYQMLVREARIGSRLDHPNVVGVVDFGSHGDQPYLVMDYVSGCSLADLLRADPSAGSTAAVVSIILEILSGLEATHRLLDDDGTELGVVHHDVSPHNILVGLDGIARLTDFGVAQLQRTLKQDQAQPRGKPGFAAPERITGAGGDRRADLFSLGVVFWTALTRRPLFEGNNAQETLSNLLTQPIAAPSVSGRSPACLDDIVLKSLQRNPDKRYQSAEEMFVELRAVAAREQLLTVPSEIGHWVGEVQGRSIDVGRLHFLDAGRAKTAMQESPLLTVQPEPERPSDPAPAVQPVPVRVLLTRSRALALFVMLVVVVIALGWPRRPRSEAAAPPASIATPRAPE